MDKHQAGEVANMKKEYIKGYLIDEEDVGCDKYPVCYTCPFPKCKDDKSKEQEVKAEEIHQNKEEDEQKERERIWMEKQRLVLLLDQKRQDAEEKAITPLIP